MQDLTNRNPDESEMNEWYVMIGENEPIGMRDGQNEKNGGEANWIIDDFWISAAWIPRDEKQRELQPLHWMSWVRLFSFTVNRSERNRSFGQSARSLEELGRKANKWKNWLIRCLIVSREPECLWDHHRCNDRMSQNSYIVWRDLHSNRG